MSDLSALETLHPDRQFNSFADYERLVQDIDELLIKNKILKIIPAHVSEWDVEARFFKDADKDIFFVLHRPEPPSKGEWAEVDLIYLGGSFRTIE